MSDFSVQHMIWYSRSPELSIKGRPVKVIHLSKPDDPRNIEGRKGIERRNQLTQIATQLRIAESAILRARGYANAKARTLAAAQSLESE